MDPGTGMVSSGDVLESIPRWRAPFGPCVGQPMGACVFDTRLLAWDWTTGAFQGEVQLTQEEAAIAALQPDFVIVDDNDQIRHVVG